MENTYMSDDETNYEQEERSSANEKFPINGKLYTRQEIGKAMQLYEQKRPTVNTERTVFGGMNEEQLPTGQRAFSSRFSFMPTQAAPQMPNSEIVVLSKKDLEALVKNLVSQNSKETPPAQTLPPANLPNLKIIKHPKQLSVLGRFQPVNQNRGKYKMISRYVENSHNIPAGFGQVVIHGIHSHKNSLAENSASETSGATSSRVSKPSKMMLWFKTTPESVKRFSQGKNTATAFYDRIGRAFAIPAKDLQQPLRQIILLCAVSLGKMHKSSQGYGAWGKRKGPTAGHDSEKGIGKLTPNWEENLVDSGVIIPCGVTQQHAMFSTNELEYNEYVIWEARRAKVMYAVDVEVIPATNSSS